MDRSDLKSFINRCNSPDFQKIVKETCKDSAYRSNKWQRENPEKQAECVRKYASTEKGAFYGSKSSYRYRMKQRFPINVVENMKLSFEEKIKIGEFYLNCPEGYEVDHIIPLAKQGRHELSNLQYLTKRENRRKRDKILDQHKELYWKEYILKKDSRPKRYVVRN